MAGLSIYDAEAKECHWLFTDRQLNPVDMFYRVQPGHTLVNLEPVSLFHLTQAEYDRQHRNGNKIKISYRQALPKL